MSLNLLIAAPTQLRQVRVRFGYSLGAGGATSEQPTALHHPLLDLLDALRGGGSIGAAARSLALSYRHVWGEIRRWEDHLGRALVHKGKGQRAALTPFAEKLLLVERQAQARFSAHIEALRMELERAFVAAYDD